MATQVMDTLTRIARRDRLVRPRCPPRSGTSETLHREARCCSSWRGLRAVKLMLKSGTVRQAPSLMMLTALCSWQLYHSFAHTAGQHHPRRLCAPSTSPAATSQTASTTCCCWPAARRHTSAPGVMPSTTSVDLASSEQLTSPLEARQHSVEVFIFFITKYIFVLPTALKVLLKLFILVLVLALNLSNNRPGQGRTSLICLVSCAGARCSRTPRTTSCTWWRTSRQRRGWCSTLPDK